MAQTKTSALIETYLQDLHPLMTDHEFHCSDKDIDKNMERLKLVYKRFSPRLKNSVEVLITVMPLPPIAMHCIAYIQAFKDNDTIDLRLNWLANSKQSIIRQFVDQFIVPLVRMLSIGLNEMPEEVCHKILDLLPYQSVVQLSRTNRFWYGVCGRDSLWEKFFRKTFTVDSYMKALVMNGDHDDWKSRFTKEFYIYKKRERRRLNAMTLASRINRDRFPRLLGRRTRSI